jgi:hypothetical protein
MPPRRATTTPAPSSSATIMHRDPPYASSSLSSPKRPPPPSVSTITGTSLDGSGITLRTMEDVLRAAVARAKRRFDEPVAALPNALPDTAPKRARLGTTNNQAQPALGFSITPGLESVESAVLLSYLLV